MRRALALIAIAAIAAIALGACKPQAAQATHASQLDNQIAAAVGDPTTCVLIAEKATGKVFYRYGDDFNCARGLPACDAPGLLNAKTAMQFAVRPGGRFASCASLPDGSRMVGWAEGPAPSSKRDLIYSAVMEGQRALPGREMNARLYDAFSKAGL